jgi:bifunctional UDP-N-acetylglucosamine pyrophosphorylase/glucosamine-1-phosphate N-acetyltransferase
MRRHLETLSTAGVTILDPARTVIEPGIRVGEDSVVHPDVSLTGNTKVGAGCVLHQGVWAHDAVIGEGCVVEAYSHLDGVVIGVGARVGPFARLRPGANVGPGAKVGNFVEIKNSTLGAGAKAGHLSYLGDAEVGEGANIGAGTITCTYDGESKHPTEIGPGAFIGSDTMLIAPVKVGKGATTAAGSVVSKDVPAGALAVERSAQRNIEGWAERRKRKRNKS